MKGKAQGNSLRFEFVLVMRRVFIYNRTMRKRRKKQFYTPGTEKLTGVLEKTKSGFGFVRQEEGGDIFVGRSNMYGAMHGDTVSVDLLPEQFRTRSREGIEIGRASFRERV